MCKFYWQEVCGTCGAEGAFELKSEVDSSTPIRFCSAVCQQTFDSFHGGKGELADTAITYQKARENVERKVAESREKAGEGGVQTPAHNGDTASPKPEA